MVVTEVEQLMQAAWRPRGSRVEVAAEALLSVGPFSRFHGGSNEFELVHKGTPCVPGLDTG